MADMTWCEFCRDHYDRDHFDAKDNHRRGPEYGPTGAAMERDTYVAELLSLLKPLMDPDYCTPFMSAWELDSYAGAPMSNGERLDGEQLHERIKAVYDRLTQEQRAQDPRPAGGAPPEPAEVAAMTSPSSPYKTSGATIPVVIQDGKPLCPDCSEPMQEMEAGAWRCAIMGPFWDRAGAAMADALDKLIASENEGAERA